MKQKSQFFNTAELLRNTWIVLAAIGGIIYWAARQDSSLADIKENRTKIGMLENRIIILENGLDKLAVKIDGMREDLSLIKSAVLK
ncbi:MAG: hypothetical protein LBQ49_00190 [Rickettsiales bacterium]|jgi:hypothetical protein|nr:hypothetical protein [Rickettsiales bacterium]